MAQLLLPSRLKIASVTIVIVLVTAAYLLGHKLALNPYKQKSGAFPEQIVYAHTNDDIFDAGVYFAPPKQLAKPTAIIWIHGWGVNFYSPTYVGIGRALANRGYATIVGNTRMHDIGNVEAWRGDKRIRGGGYWGITSDQTRDIKAWIDFAEEQGFKQVVLVGHSAGAAAVRNYQALTRDPRVVGVVLASGGVRPPAQPPDSEQLAEAKKMIAAGRPEDLVRDPKRSFPSFISSATFLDMLAEPLELKDFFGTQIANAGITKVRCPVLAFYGTSGDVAGQEDLDIVKSSIARLHAGPRTITTSLISGADHMYSGQEDQVASAIATWIAGSAPDSNVQAE
jgi:pimeloyl-ACP methyl ester carboxylesterase